MSDESFVRLSRGFFRHPFWEEDREYSRAEAWLDLVHSVSWRNKSTLVKGSLMQLRRGGIVASERFLSERWKWSRTKVRTFLELLENEEMINRKKDHENTIIFLCNFDKYNPEKTAERTTKEPPKDHKKDHKKTGSGDDIISVNNGPDKSDVTEKEPPASPEKNQIEEVEERIYISPREGDESGSDNHPGFEPPLERYIALAATYSIPAWYARAKWEVFSAKAWHSGKTPLHWKKTMPMVKSNFVNDGSPMKEPSGPIGPRQEKAIQPPAPSLHGKPCRLV